MDNSCVIPSASRVQTSLSMHSCSWKDFHQPDWAKSSVLWRKPDCRNHAGTTHVARSQNPSAPIAPVPGSQSQHCIQGPQSLGLPSFEAPALPGSPTALPAAWVLQTQEHPVAFWFALKATSAGSPQRRPQPAPVQSLPSGITQGFDPAFRESALWLSRELVPARPISPEPFPGPSLMQHPTNRKPSHPIHLSCIHSKRFVGGIERVGSPFLTCLFWSLWLLVQEHCCYFQRRSCCWSWPLLLWFLFPAALLRWTISSISSSGRPPLLPLACRNFFCLVWYF